MGWFGQGGGGGGAGGAVEAVLLACEQIAAQEFADLYGLDTWAIAELVFVAWDGSVFLGQGRVDERGGLTVLPQVLRRGMDKFVVGGGGRPVASDAAGRSPVTGLSLADVADLLKQNPGLVWQQRLGQNLSALAPIRTGHVEPAAAGSAAEVMSAGADGWIGWFRARHALHSAERARVQAERRLQYATLRDRFSTVDVPVAVAGDDFYYTLFHGLNAGLPPSLRAADGANPTRDEIQRLRDGLADRVAEAFEKYNERAAGSAGRGEVPEPGSVVRLFPRAWGPDVDVATRMVAQEKHVRIIRTMGDYTARVDDDVEPTGSFAVAAAAELFGLPLTVLGVTPVQVGPEGEAPVGYVHYTGGRYMVVVPPAGEQVRPAAEVLLPPLDAEPPVPLSEDELQAMVEAFVAAAADLSGRLGGLAPADRERARRVLADMQRLLAEESSPAQVLRLAELHATLVGLVAARSGLAGSLVAGVRRWVRWVGRRGGPAWTGSGLVMPAPQASATPAAVLAGAVDLLAGLSVEQAARLRLSAEAQSRHWYAVARGQRSGGGWMLVLLFRSFPELAVLMAMQSRPARLLLLVRALLRADAVDVTEAEVARLGGLAETAAGRGDLSLDGVRRVLAYERLQTRLGLTEEGVREVGDALGLGVRPDWVERSLEAAGLGHDLADPAVAGHLPALHEVLTLMRAHFPHETAQVRGPLGRADLLPLVRLLVDPAAASVEARHIEAIVNEAASAGWSRWQNRVFGRGSVVRLSGLDRRLRRAAKQSAGVDSSQARRAEREALAAAWPAVAGLSARQRAQRRANLDALVYARRKMHVDPRGRGFTDVDDYRPMVLALLGESSVTAQSIESLASLVEVARSAVAPEPVRERVGRVGRWWRRVDMTVRRRGTQVAAVGRPVSGRPRTGGVGALAQRGGRPALGVAGGRGDGTDRRPQRGRAGAAISSRVLGFGRGDGVA